MIFILFLVDLEKKLVLAFTWISITGSHQNDGIILFLATFA